MDRCSRCGEYIFRSTERCNCRPFRVYYPEYFGEDEETIYAVDAESTAEKLAERLNEDEPVFEEDLFEKPVRVTDEDGEVMYFNCHASISIDYFAEEVDENKSDN